MNFQFKKINSPVGELTLVANDASLVAVLWPDDGAERVTFLRQASGEESSAKTAAREPAVLKQAAKQLGEYFRGERTAFDLPLEFHGTDFQKKVWQALQEIPFGESRSYSQLAKKIGRPKACRAVGAANGRNPLSIVVPCHRVIGQNGQLTGFAGGLEAKKFLLEHEA